MRIEINLSLRRLKLFDPYGVKGVYPVAIGKPATPTPAGNYHITRKVINPGGILGSRWLELSIPSHDGPYGIHGTTMPWSIGNAASNGCVRMYNEHVEEVFSQVGIGTAVTIAHGDSFPTLKEENDTPDDGHPNYYLVQPGDTLWRIASHYGVPLDKLINLNQLSDPSRIYPGQKLRLN